MFSCSPSRDPVVALPEWLGVPESYLDVSLLGGAGGLSSASHPSGVRAVVPAPLCAGGGSEAKPSHLSLVVRSV